MLEDARKTTGLEDTLQVMDLNELMAMALAPPASRCLPASDNVI